MLFVVVVGINPHIGTHIHAAIIEARVAVAVEGGNFGAKVGVADGYGIAFVAKTEVEYIRIAVDVELRVGVPAALNEVVVVAAGRAEQRVANEHIVTREIVDIKFLGQAVEYAVVDGYRGFDAVALLVLENYIDKRTAFDAEEEVVGKSAMHEVVFSA